MFAINTIYRYFPVRSESFEGINHIKHLKINQLFMTENNGYSTRGVQNQRSQTANLETRKTSINVTLRDLKF